MSKNIYPILVDNDEMQELFDILNKYQETILQMAKLAGSDAAAAHDRAAKIINGLLERADESISPPPCISKACLNSDYCYMPSQCGFIQSIKDGFKAVRTNEELLPMYLAAGWEIRSVDDSLKPSAKKYLLIYPK